MLIDAPSTGILVKNLHALSAVGHGDLVKRLESPAGGAPIEVLKDPSGKINVRFIGWHHPWLHDQQTIPKIKEKLKNDPFIRSSILLLGIGLGFELDAILSETSSKIKIFAYERYPELLKLALSMRDYSREIFSNRIIFLLGSDLAAYPWDHENLPGLIFHPILGTIYQEECLWWEKHHAGFQRPLTCLVNSKGLLARDILDEFLSMGINAYPIDVEALSPSEITSQIKKLSPHFLMTINHVKGLPKICARLGIPLVIWEIDPRIELLPDDEISSEAVRNTVRIYTYKRSLVTDYTKTGFRHAKYLPLAANTRKYRPMKIDLNIYKGYEADVSFVGNSMQLQGDWLLEKAISLLRRLNPQLNVEEIVFNMINAQLAYPDAFVLPKLIHDMLHQMSYYSSVVTDEKGRKINIETCLSEKAASERRIQAVNTLAGLAKEKVVKVWGDEGWRKRLSPPIIYAGPAGHFHELPVIYNASRINLDINRLYQKDIVTLRIFDILACKAFVLADDSPELNLLFRKGEEIISFKKISQIPSICEYYLKHEDERKEIAQKGYEKVLKEHSLRKRLSFIMDELNLS
ncbi:MAG: glycosyltransferase [Thermodesulforhabdaceae bacterium]